jgi:hypothetical protein
MKSVLPLVGLLFFVVSHALCASPQETVREFQEGKFYKFSVLGHAKAKGTNFSIKYPQSWMAKEGERPNVVQNFVSDNGKGLEMAMILTKTIPPEEPFSQADILSTQGLASFMPQGGKLLRTSSTKIEGEPAGLFEYTHRQQRAGMEIEMHYMGLAFFQGRTLVTVMCSVYGSSAGEASRRFELFRPLFSIMMNSIIFDGKWK